MAAPEQWLTDVPPAGTASWYVRGERHRYGYWRVRCHVDDRHPDGEVIAEPGPLDDVFLLWDADLDELGRPMLRVAPAVAPDAPPMWFVHLHEPNAAPQATTLVAFATDHLPPGTVVTDPVFFHMPVHSAEQIGAIRWWHGEAVVDQIFVRSDMRRRQVATAIIYAASAFHQCNGWDGRLHADGRRTTMGEALVTALRHPDRIAARTAVMPSMDPPRA